jgi:hypothetical protein
MHYKIRTQPEEWACTKFCRIDLADDSVANFILWLCDHASEQVDTRIAARSKDDVIWYDPVESTWGWDAPRQRMAKLLWRLLHGSAGEEDFRQRFSFPTPLRTSGCAQILAPIQKRLKWVMDGFFSRQKQDRELGQGDWGEHWWLPEEQAEFVRTQLRQSTADLIEQTSDYDDALAFGMCFHIRHTVQAIAIPCRDSARVYVGTRRGPHDRVFVWVQSENGRQFPLKHGKTAYREAVTVGGVNWKTAPH